MKKSHKVGERSAPVKPVAQCTFSTMLLPANVSPAQLEILRATLYTHMIAHMCRPNWSWNIRPSQKKQHHIYKIYHMI